MIHTAYSFMDNLDWNFVLTVVGLATGMFFGVYSLRKDILKELKMNQVDEKVAMLWGYAESVQHWHATNPGIVFSRAMADLAAVRRISRAISQEQEQTLRNAITSLTDELNAHGYGNFIPQVNDEFRLILITKRKRWIHCKGYNYEL